MCDDFYEFEVLIPSQFCSLPKPGLSIVLHINPPAAKNGRVYYCVRTKAEPSLTIEL